MDIELIIAIQHTALLIFVCTLMWFAWFTVEGVEDPSDVIKLVMVYLLCGSIIFVGVASLARIWS